MDEQMRNETVPANPVLTTEPFAAEKAAVKAEIVQEVQGAVDEARAFVDQAAEAVEDVSDVMIDAKDELVTQLRARKRALAQRVRSSKDQIDDRVRTNPWPFVVGSLIVGLIIGGAIGANADRD